jgi:hypothetical protein
MGMHKENQNLEKKKSKSNLEELPKSKNYHDEEIFSIKYEKYTVSQDSKAMRQNRLPLFPE